MGGESVDPRLLIGGHPQGHTGYNSKSPNEKFPEAIRIAQVEFGKHRSQVVPT